VIFTGLEMDISKKRKSEKPQYRRWSIPGREPWLSTKQCAIPLEDMDLMVNPVDQKLVGIHGDEAVAMIK
jgi:hypothetical protein